MQPASRKTSASLFRAYDSVRQPQWWREALRPPTEDLRGQSGPERSSARATGFASTLSLCLDLKFGTRKDVILAAASSRHDGVTIYDTKVWRAPRGVALFLVAGKMARATNQGVVEIAGGTE